MSPDLKHHEYIGALHVHSKYSDGDGTVEDIVSGAKKAKLDYIIITDHNTLQAMDEGAEGWYDDLLVLVGEEIGTRYGSHYLAFGISDVIEPDDRQLDVRRYIEMVKRQGGIGFAAHPQGLHNTSFDLKLSPWDAWDDPNYTGLEVWSYMCDWVESVTKFNVLYYYLRPGRAISGPSPEILRRWDALCQMRRVVGVGGVDAHARYIPPFNFIKFLSYRRAFRGVRTHLLTPSPLNHDLDESKKLVYSALRSGHCFFAHDRLADSRGFDFKASTDDGRVLLMGDEIKLTAEAKLEATSPVPASLRLLRNGQPVRETFRSRRLTWRTTTPGVYRVEARYGGRPWVFTNPIYLR